VPQALSAPATKATHAEFVFTRFPLLTLLAVPDFVKPNHGKSPEFTEGRARKW
jgi:hypothetical protein